MLSGVSYEAFHFTLKTIPQKTDYLMTEAFIMWSIWIHWAYIITNAYLIIFFSPLSVQPSNARDDPAITWHINSRKHYDSLIVEICLWFVWVLGKQSLKAITTWISYTVYMTHLVFKMQIALHLETICNYLCTVGLKIFDRSVQNTSN